MKDSVLIVLKMDCYIEDEYHILITCKRYEMLRNHHSSKLIQNSLLQSFINVMSTNDFDVIYNICVFLHKFNKI